MANQTRGQIKTRLYQYLPQMSRSDKSQLVNDCIDAATEEISRRHDFRSLKPITYDTATMTAGQWQVSLSDFAVMGAATTAFKEISYLVWLLPTSNVDYWEIRYKDDPEWLRDVGYYDDPLATRGKPSIYTQIQDKFLFDCPLDETIILRAFYTQYHPKFLNDNISHMFNIKDDMLAANAILYGALVELKASLTGIEFPQELAAPEQTFEKYVARLIASDRDDPNETIEINWSEKSPTGRFDLNPYDWVNRGYGVGGYGDGGYGD